jgi:hypothetical protein
MHLHVLLNGRTRATVAVGDDGIKIHETFAPTPLLYLHVSDVRPPLTDPNSFIPYREMWGVRREPDSKCCVYAIKRGKKHRWRPHKHDLQGEESDINALVSALQAHIIHDRARPARLKVFINPFGGRRKAVKNMSVVRGLFQIAGVCIAAAHFTSTHTHTRIQHTAHTDTLMHTIYPCLTQRRLCWMRL